MAYGLRSWIRSRAERRALIMTTSRVRLCYSRLLQASALLLVGLTAELPAQSIAITGGRVFPVSGPAIDNGTVLIRDGKIVAVGTNVSVPADARRIDASGKWVTPGIFNAATVLGITEVNAVQGTVDAYAKGKGDAVTASFKAWEGFNPASPLLQVTRNDGITTVGIIPGGQMISGQAAVLDLVDGTSLGELMLRCLLYTSP